MSRGINCQECGCTIHGEYMVINGEVVCIDCAEEWMEDEVVERKHESRSWYREMLAEALGIQILEV